MSTAEYDGYMSILWKIDDTFHFVLCLKMIAENKSAIWMEKPIILYMNIKIIQPTNGLPLILQ